MLRPLAALACASALASCNYYTEHRFSTFEKAVQMPQTNADCPVYWSHSDLTNLPASAIFAQVNGNFDGGSDASFARGLKAHVEELGWKPDYMVYQRGGANYAGSVSTYVGFGVAVSNPNYRQNATAWCFRVAPATIGVKLNKSLMVTNLTEEARASGLQEGDTILTIAGASLEAPSSAQVSEWRSKMLDVQVGEVVKVIWVRPGTGRMEGDLVMQPNRPFPEEADPMDMKPPPLRNNKARKWRRGA